MMKVVHIIPTFNEKENIAAMIDVLEKIFKKLPEWKNEILVVDDYSPDGTAGVVQDYQKKYNNIHLLSKKKEGLGSALIKGYERAIELGADVVIPNDADFQWDPEDIPKLLAKINEGFDVVVASRHVKGGNVIGWNRFRELNHDISNSLLAWWVAGVKEVHDHAGNFKAIRVKGVLDKVSLDKMKNAGFSFQLHILYELSKVGAKFTEVPAVFKERRYGKSKIGFNRYYIRDVFEYVKNSFIIRFDRSQAFMKYGMVGTIGFLIQTIISKILISFSFFPGIAVAVGAEMAIVSNFLFNNFWTFSQKKIEGNKIFSKFLQFNLVSFGAVIIQGVVVGLATIFFGKNIWFPAMVFAIIFIVIPYSYLIYNSFIWKTK
ncbi:MAG: Glycosyltransferase [Candidatus Gottesmanbacteria bacterium GW2011_GWC2_39_8]|uniref:Glycosyltransferase n=1 Tax=Candidatus Gottesmanbacteria bacterium GW2011_GWC2_39_8 TaxID=1618450 RepID=A0A0G0Q1S6_9BACT|nr:MAG: Glycosyltransferase [Candidatus Gottesmanbacteria bacterium GW2011_GWC2_39_8]